MKLIFVRNIGFVKTSIKNNIQLDLVALKRYSLQSSRGEMCNSFRAYLRVWHVSFIKNNKKLLKITCRLKLNLNYLELNIYKNVNYIN